MAVIQLTKLTNQIYYNIKDPNVDYFVLNPFDENGNLSLNEMNVIVDLRGNIWNTNPFLFLIPDIQKLPSLNFKVNFTLYGLKYEGSTPPGIIVGNYNDNWDGGVIGPDGGVMTWIPTAIDPVNNTYGWWLVENPSTPLFLGAQSSNEPILMSASNTTSIGGHENFRELFQHLQN